MPKVVFPVLFITIAVYISGCRLSPYGGYDYPDGHFPESPVNFAEVNTPYNDYNISSPTIHSERYFHFSSDRASHGTHFDIVGEDITLEWSKENGTFSCNLSGGEYRALIDDVLRKVNTSRNEFGPYSLFFRTADDWLGFMLFFSRELSENNLDNFVITATQSSDNSWNIDTVRSCMAVNSTASDGYLSFFGKGFINQSYHGWAADMSITQAYFCSDKAGDFDIYRIPVPAGTDLPALLTRTTSDPGEKCTELCSSGNDKCPYINGNVMVFASDRTGGSGGFDLYYSKYENGAWTEPVNFGGAINTPYDEYRPVILAENEFDNDLLFFSSDRPGGKGDFDIYYCGVPALVDEDL